MDPSEPPPPDPHAAPPGSPPPGMPASLTAHSKFIKRARCARCGAPKTMPSKTAYLYCDFCGALVDYDFRIANEGTNAGITNTIYAQILAPHQGTAAAAKAQYDYETYRQLMLYVFQEWINRCPNAVSPRAKTDPEFRDRMIRYCAEASVCKDLDPYQQQMDAQNQQLIASLERVPVPGGAWMVWGDTFWQMATLWKQQIDHAYQKMAEVGVTAMDPDDPPPGVAVKMEYSTFCQAWLPHLTPADGERLLEMYGLTGDYTQFSPQPTEQHACGNCGAELRTVVGARVVVCEECGRRIEVNVPAVPCRHCGAPLNYPVGVQRLSCPYCHSETARV